MTALLDGVGHFPLAYSGDEHRSGSHDEQSHLRNASDSYPNKIVDGAGGDDVRNITAKRPRSVQQVGDWVCHYGRVTDYECGTIVTKTITPCGGVGTPSSTGIQVHNPNNVDLAQGGDSGGPWFFGPAADGTLSCQFGLDGIYVAINYIESGLDVLLATN
jgi:hypothetical protein